MLKRGVATWNQWRGKAPKIKPDLCNAPLSGANLDGAHLGMADLAGAHLGGAYLRGADLAGANLKGAHLGWANLAEAHLRGANLGEANLGGANLDGADLRKTNLRGAYLFGADLSKANLVRSSLFNADLRRANLRRANLIAAILAGPHLRGADLTNAEFGFTTFTNVDLSEVKGLETVEHGAPSSIGIDTIFQSGGNIPEVFLRGCGVPEDFIVYMRALVNNPIEYYSLFISYSSKDEEFARRLHADLQARGVRCWFAPHDMAIGDKIRDRIDESIRVYDKLLLILSHDSIFSNWVEKEVETAFEKEERQGKLVLFPIRLDEEVMATNKAWAADIRRARRIGDFTRWKEHDAYQEALARLLRDLKASAQAAG